MELFIPARLAVLSCDLARPRLSATFKIDRGCLCLARVTQCASLEASSSFEILPTSTRTSPTANECFDHRLRFRGTPSQAAPSCHCSEDPHHQASHTGHSSGIVAIKSHSLNRCKVAKVEICTGPIMESAARQAVFFCCPPGRLARPEPALAKATELSAQRAHICAPSRHYATKSCWV
jgi:hypothetical protein